MKLIEAVNEFIDQENLGSNEGRRGVENLCRLVRALGYRNSTRHEPIDDLVNFLEDNSGCIEAIKEWIEKQNVQEWADNLESELPEVCECCGRPLMDDSCSDCD